jgi:hypothetical protein
MGNVKRCGNSYGLIQINKVTMGCICRSSVRKRKYVSYKIVVGKFLGRGTYERLKR